MPLAALIAAYHESDEPGGGLRATLPLAGGTLVERQARLAAAAGVHRIILVVERVPASLAASVDRLGAQGLNIVVARSAAEAAGAVGEQDLLLVMADGLVADAAHVSRLLDLGPPIILTVPDTRVDDRYERIDAQSRWAGLALVDGEMLKATAEMLGEWDLQSTLLRRAVQSGARQLSVRGEPADDLLIVAERAEDLGELQRRIFEGASARRQDWVSRHLLGPLEQELTRRLMPTSATSATLTLGAAVLTALSGLAFGSQWFLLGLLFLLAATPLDGAGERLAALRLEDPDPESWWSHLLPAVAAAALLALGIGLAESRGWGCILLAGVTIAFSLALRTEVGGAEVPGRIWLAERKGMSWLLLPFAAAGLWATGLGALAVYAAGSFFWAQRHVHRRSSAPRPD